MSRMAFLAAGTAAVAAVTLAGIPPEGSPAPEFIGEGWSDGGDYSWDRLAGKVVVLSFYYADG